MNHSSNVIDNLLLRVSTVQQAESGGCPSFLPVHRPCVDSCLPHFWAFCISYPSTAPSSSAASRWTRQRPSIPSSSRSGSTTSRTSAVRPCAVSWPPVCSRRTSPPRARRSPSTTRWHRVSQPASQFPGLIHHGETELVSCWCCCAQCPSFPRSSSSSARPRLRRAERCGVRGLLTARGVLSVSIGHG